MSLLIAVIIFLIIRNIKKSYNCPNIICDEFDIKKSFSLQGNTFTKINDNATFNFKSFIVQLLEKDGSLYVKMTILPYNVTITSPTYDDLVLNKKSENDPFIQEMYSVKFGWFARTDILNSKIICLRSISNINSPQVLTFNTSNKQISITGPNDTSYYVLNQ